LLLPAISIGAPLNGAAELHSYARLSVHSYKSHLWRRERGCTFRCSFRLSRQQVELSCGPCFITKFSTKFSILESEIQYTAVLLLNLVSIRR
jgi:hypothetical protein